MATFMDALDETLGNEYNVSITENGAIGYRSTKHPILDMNFKVSSYRKMSETDIVNDFIQALNEDESLAIKWLFFVRDVRVGLGERRLFRVCIKCLASYDPDVTKKDSSVDF